MDKNTFWSYTTPLESDVDYNSCMSSNSQSNVCGQDYSYVIYISEEELVKQELEVIYFDSVESSSSGSSR